MRKEGSHIVRPALRFLDEQGIRAIHDAALSILEHTGVMVHLEAARDLLTAAGCSAVDPQRVSIPAALVEQAIEHAPSEVRVFSREGEPALELGGTATGEHGVGMGPAVRLQLGRAARTGANRSRSILTWMMNEP